ncbi:MAG TPA: copper resistance protein CopC [Anaerolineae bacterium]|nr:copper resistance protein CopC [Anaerolineae bacterium]
MRTTRKLSLFFLLLAGLAVTAVTAAAHGEEILLKSEPADGAALPESPAQVTTWFSDELAATSTLKVYNLAGKQVDNGDGGVDLNDPDHASMIVSLPPLDEGVYLVQWTAVLLDSDTVTGAFTFGVGEAGKASAPVTVNIATATPTAPESASASGRPAPAIWLIGGIGLILLAGLAGFAIARGR